MKKIEVIEPEEDDDEDVATCRFLGTGRLVLHTRHGLIIIDIRPDDVNAFAFGSEPSLRQDHILLKRKL